MYQVYSDFLNLQYFLHFFTSSEQDGRGAWICSIQSLSRSKWLFFLLSLLFIQWHQLDFFDRCTLKRLKMVDQYQSFQLCLFHWSILDWFNDHSRFHFYPCDNGLFIRVHPVIENKKSETSSNRLLGDTDVVFNRALSQNQLRATNFWSQLGMDWLCDSTEFVWINWTHSLSKHQ